jgi:hypothetical protein
LSPRELVRVAERGGWSATLRPGGHWMLTHPDATEPVFFAATPSCWRWHLNTLAQMRRALPPEPKLAPLKLHPERPRQRPPPAHRPEPLRDYPEPLTMFKLPEPERRLYPPEPPPRRRIPGGPAGYRSCLNRV